MEGARLRRNAFLTGCAAAGTAIAAPLPTANGSSSTAMELCDQVSRPPHCLTTWAIFNTIINEFPLKDGIILTVTRFRDKKLE